MERLCWLVIVGVGMLAPSVVLAGDGPGKASGWVSEVKGGVLVHDFTRPAGTRNGEDTTIDVNAEVLFRKLKLVDSENLVVQKLFHVRPAVGVQINTSNRTHQLYGGIVLDQQFAGGVFADFFFGLTVHDGQLESHDPGNDRPNLGSPVLFREALDVGYRFSGGHSFAASIAHMSHAGLFARENDSMNFVGMRYGFRFD